MMHRRTRENLLYVGEAWISRFGGRVFRWGLLAVFGGGIVWSFNAIDAYLTPSWAKEETVRFQETNAPHAAFVKADKAQARDHLAIGKLGVWAPLSFVRSTSPTDFLGPLKKGVVHYPSVLPGEQGTAIILGHSSPLPWLGNNYTRVFSGLKDLEQGDLVSVTVRGKEYAYRVVGQRILNRGQDIPSELMQAGRPKLLLISCWPPGIDNKRIMVQADLIKNF